MIWFEEKKKASFYYLSFANLLAVFLEKGKRNGGVVWIVVSRRAAEELFSLGGYPCVGRKSCATGSRCAPRSGRCPSERFVVFSVFARDFPASNDEVVDRSNGRAADPADASSAANAATRYSIVPAGHNYAPEILVDDAVEGSGRCRLPE